MKRNQSFSPLLLLSFPFLWGYAIMHLPLQTFETVYSSRALLWEALFIVFWFWTGMLFARLPLGKIKSFALGNSVWVIFLALYVWQAILDINRLSPRLTIVAQAYSFPVLSYTARLLGLFVDSFEATTLLLLAFFFMLVIFTLGFVFQSYRKPPFYYWR